jgi:hypothetical protein
MRLQNILAAFAEFLLSRWVKFSFKTLDRLLRYCFTCEMIYLDVQEDVLKCLLLYSAWPNTFKIIIYTKL